MFAGQFEDLLPNVKVVISLGFDFGHEDYFIIETFVDANSNHVFISYGFNWKGTWAAGIYLKAEYPTIQQFTNVYYVFHWVDANGDGIPQTSEIAQVATG